jgi:enoyl-[acyl-carrier protein] reductase/trans-2-enoyl-CoA reductase (NAD+)
LGNEARCSRKIAALWLEATTENIAEISDLEGYRRFHNLFFGFNGVDYKAEANEMVSVKSIN